jgi:hypothetical protein
VVDGQAVLDLAVTEREVARWRGSAASAAATTVAPAFASRIKASATFYSATF